MIAQKNWENEIGKDFQQSIETVRKEGEDLTQQRQNRKFKNVQRRPAALNFSKVSSRETVNKLIGILHLFLKRYLELWMTPL